MRAERGLYLHIPFCASKCPYCDFYSARADDSVMDAYRDALTDEIRTGRRAAAFTDGGDRYFSTVYIGGGTPSLFGAKRLCAVLDAVRERFVLAPDAEITVEVNPSSAGEELFRALHGAGVNRISLGLQSAVDGERRALGRRAGAREVEGAVRDALRAGIDNLSLDLMLGIPGQTRESLAHSLSFCIGLPVRHISAYLLTLEENTPFYRRAAQLALPDEDETASFYLTTVETLARAGFAQYEISNFAQKGYESRHNLIYWHCDPYLGIGASAHSFLNGVRFFSPPDTAGFLAGEPARLEGDGGTEEEYVMLALRLTEGVSYQAFAARFGKPFPERYKKACRDPRYAPYFRPTEQGFALTPSGFLLSNELIAAVLYP